MGRGGRPLPGPRRGRDRDHARRRGALPAPPRSSTSPSAPTSRCPTSRDTAEHSPNPAWWRDQRAGRRAARRRRPPFHADVDFGKLAARHRRRRAACRQTGPIDRILASRFEFDQGVDFDDCVRRRRHGCHGQLRGRLQPYALYVPKKPPPAGGYGLTLLLHALAANYNQFLGSRNQSQFGERGAGSIVITPEGRGPDGWYNDHAGADIFEVWADVARRYRLDPALTTIAGYSMGGCGTYKLAAQ